MKRRDPIEVDCPICGANAGMRCLEYGHWGRLIRAEEEELLLQAVREATRAK